jgi:putative DNA primase/helicase
MTGKQSIAGTQPVPLEPEVLIKENRKEDEFEAMRNDPELQRSIAEREEKEAGKVKEGNSLEEDSGKIRAGHSVQRDNLPPEIKKSYIEIDGKYYFSGRPDSLAFEDRGRRLRTRLSHGNVAGSMVDMAKAKGWTEIRVKGKEEFRREAWLHAVSKGLAVRGYSPRDEDLARLKKLVRERDEDKPGLQAKEQEDEPVNRLTGKLVDHGKAPYQHDKDNRESYFVTLENSDGNESTTWGVDLERAVSESGAKQGDQIELENHGRQPVTIDRPVKDEKGNVIRTEKVNTHRNQWEVNAEALRNEKEDLAQLARDKPGLINEIAAIKMGGKVSRNFSCEADRQRFMDRVRERVADNYLKGKETAAIKVKEERTIERPDREKEAENDR